MRMERFIGFLTLAALIASLSMSSASCGGNADTGDDGPDNFLVPDYERQTQKARDAADSVEQKQQEIEDDIRTMQEGP